MFRSLQISWGNLGLTRLRGRKCSWSFPWANVFFAWNHPRPTTNKSNRLSCSRHDSLAPIALIDTTGSGTTCANRKWLTRNYVTKCGPMALGLGGGLWCQKRPGHRTPPKRAKLYQGEWEDETKRGWFLKLAHQSSLPVLTGSVPSVLSKTWLIRRLIRCQKSRRHLAELILIGDRGHIGSESTFHHTKTCTTLRPHQYPPKLESSCVPPRPVNHQFNNSTIFRFI